MNCVCNAPFFTAEIFGGGNVCLCCPSYTKLQSIGNIFEKSWDEIWNCKEAQEFREKIKKGDYSSCNLNYCNPEFFPMVHETKYIDPQRLDYENPKARIIKFSMDRSCNVMCTICRDRLICNNNSERTKFLDEHIEKLFLPILKDADIVNFTGTGDPFSSKHDRKFIKLAAQKYPNLRFDLHTNGTLCDENNLKELGILDRLSTIQISLHSASKETYDKIVKCGNWERLNKNLEFLASLKDSGKLNELQLNFVILSENYKDIPKFIELTKKYKAKAFLWQYRDIDGIYDYDSVNVCSPVHPEHKNFVKIMTEIDTSDRDLFITPLLRKYTQIKNIEEYNLYASIFATQNMERYETGNSVFEKRFMAIEKSVANHNLRLQELCENQKFIEKIFSVKNENSPNGKHKIVRILGIKLKFKK